MTKPKREMKISRSEVNLYNYIQQQKVVTFPHISQEFGKGTAGTHALFVPHAMSSWMLTNETAVALRALVVRGSVFEIACGQKFHEFMAGGAPKGLEIVTVTHDDLKGNHITPDTGVAYWLPCVFCSAAGVKGLLHMGYIAAGRRGTPLYNKVLNDLADGLGSKDPLDRLRSAGHISYTLSNSAKDTWDKLVDRCITIDKLELPDVDDLPEQHTNPLSELRGSTLRI